MTANGTAVTIKNLSSTAYTNNNNTELTNSTAKTTHNLTTNNISNTRSKRFSPY